jgi:hypothetical protein
MEQIVICLNSSVSLLSEMHFDNIASCESNYTDEIYKKRTRMEGHKFLSFHM